MKNVTKGKVIKGVAVGIDVLGPFIATLTQFPVWVDKSAEATMSGLFLVFAALSVIPFFKQIKAFIKSPSVWVLWCVLFVFFVALQSIISEMLVVCFWGMVANIIGTVIYKIGDHVQGKPDATEEVIKEKDVKEGE